MWTINEVVVPCSLVSYDKMPLQLKGLWAGWHNGGYKLLQTPMAWIIQTMWNLPVWDRRLCHRWHTIQQHEVSSACIRPASRHRPGLTQKPEGVWVAVHSFSPFFLPPSWPGLLPPNTVTPVQATLRKYRKPWGKFIPCTSSRFWPIGVKH